jgi:hypothetical protein
MIEVLKQALEALENFADVVKYDNEQDYIGCRACCYVLAYDQHSENCQATKAITAIKEAIREHAMYEVQRLGQEIEQEPVAWVQDVEFEQLPEFAFSWVKTRLHDKPLYTHPPRHTEQNFCPRCGKRTNDIHTCTLPQRTEQEPVGFAGIEVWIGNTRIKKLMTQTELHSAIDPWAIVKFHSDSCIDALKEKNT